MTTDLNTIAAKLAEARADLALRERLDTAPARVKALIAEFDEARAAKARAEEAATKEASDARFRGLADLCVTAGDGVNGLLLQPFSVSWTAPVWDMYTMTSPPKPQSREGFMTVPDHVLAFLIEKHPEKIPAEIMALAPGDPAAAMEAYLRACQRGYTKGQAAA